MRHTVVEQPRCDGRLGTVHSRDALTRRTLLGAALLSVVGCRKPVKLVAPAPAVEPDAAALLSARTIEQLLLASYDAKITRASARNRARLQVARAVHAAHLDALQGTSSTTADIAVVANLRRALRTSVVTLRGLSLAAIDGTNAALFASIAASHETSSR